MEETKPYKIPKQIVKIAFERVKANKGTYGIDEQSIADFERNLKNNLYKKEVEFEYLKFYNVYFIENTLSKEYSFFVLKLFLQIYPYIQNFY